VGRNRNLILLYYFALVVVAAGVVVTTVAGVPAVASVVATTVVTVSVSVVGAGAASTTTGGVATGATGSAAFSGVQARRAVIISVNMFFSFLYYSAACAESATLSTPLESSFPAVHPIRSAKIKLIIFFLHFIYFIYQTRYEGHVNSHKSIKILFIKQYFYCNYK
jgi:hypothetical protein